MLTGIAFAVAAGRAGRTVPGAHAAEKEILTALREV